MPFVQALVTHKARSTPARAKPAPTPDAPRLQSAPAAGCASGVRDTVLTPPAAIAVTPGTAPAAAPAPVPMAAPAEAPAMRPASPEAASSPLPVNVVAPAMAPSAAPALPPAIPIAPPPVAVQATDNHPVPPESIPDSASACAMPPSPMKPEPLTHRKMDIDNSAAGAGGRQRSAVNASPAASQQWPIYRPTLRHLETSTGLTRQCKARKKRRHRTAFSAPGFRTRSSHIAVHARQGSDRRFRLPGHPAHRAPGPGGEGLFEIVPYPEGRGSLP